MKTASLALLGSVVMLGVLVVPRARANEWNQESILTFNTPVEIPGRVLSPGSYMFRVADTGSRRDVIEIYNAQGTKLIEAVMAASQYRLNAPNHLVVTFEERSAKAPPAVKEWFYPGRNWGHEFLYQAIGKKKS